MNTENIHIIRRQRVELQFGSMETGMGMQDYLATLFYERLQPRMEILFNEMADASHLVHADSLEIDCGILPEKNWEEEWVDTALRKLKEKLLALDKKQLGDDKIHGDFFYFLEHGLLPWNSTIKSAGTFEEKIVFDNAFLEQLQENMHQRNIIQRLLHQFSENFITHLIGALLKKNKRIIAEFLPRAAAGEPRLNRVQQQMILEAMSKKNSEPSGSNGSGAIKKAAGKQVKNDEDKDAPEAIFINNAGLVILHPFLPALFDNLQLVQDNKWISEEAQHRAVFITQCLVTGAVEAPEFDLSLNKLLCGLQITDLLLDVPETDPQVQDACEELLTAVIEQWNSLKHTGIAALRETFLQRNGKLGITNNGWLLQAEQKAVDVLLSRLPWGIGVIKLPWMKQILHTEWNG